MIKGNAEAATICKVAGWWW